MVRSECVGSQMPAFDFSKQLEPLLGYDARPVLQEAAGTVRRSLGLEAGGREASWRVMRVWADNSSKDGGISLGHRIYIQRHIRLSESYSRGVEGTKGVPDDWFLALGPRRKAGLLT